MRQRAVKWAKDFGLIRLSIIAVLVLVIIWAGSIAFHRLFLAPGEAKKAEATLVVAREQGNAEQVITSETLNTMRDREVVRTDVRDKVSRGKAKIHAEARKPRTTARPSNDDAVHNAGLAALCELRDSFCGDAGSAPLQPVH